MWKWLRRIVGLFFTLVVVGIVVLAGGYVWLRGSLPETHGRVAVPGLSGEASVVRDDNGVPHIYAATDEDALFTLGYVHGQDRLWQMEMLRRVGQGRLSEIAGTATLDFDKLVRTLGFYRQAERIVGRLDADGRTRLDAYTAGVNAYLDSRRGPLPPEFLIIGIEPEPWRPADSIVWGKVMNLQLSGNWFSERLRLALSRRLTPGQLADLWPPESGDAPVTLANLMPLHRRVAALAGDGGRPDGVELPGLSNEWAVAGRHTVSGQPLLANDPHLGYQAPNLWYLVRIETPDSTLTGATVPGVPLVLLGHNRHIAWGLTTTGSDVADLYIERLAPGDNSRYLTPEGSAPFEVREETIRVKDEADFTLTIRDTRHGPIVSDLWQQDGPLVEPGHVLAVQAAFLRDDDFTAQAVMRVNRAENWAGFVEALRGYQGPQQNFVYADVEGNIGFIAPGLVPLRRQGDGFMPVPGWTAEYDWTGFVPFDSLPRVLNPDSGRLINANNAVVGPDYSHFLSREWENRFRAERISELLDAAGAADIDAFRRMQGDNLSGAARSLVPRLVTVPAADAALELPRRLVAGWDFTMSRGRAEPLIFTAWLAELNKALYGDELGSLVDRYWGLRPEVVEHMLGRRQNWCDDIATPAAESCDSRIALALANAVADLEARFGDDPLAWRWGDAHPAMFRHRIFDYVPVVRDIASPSIAADGSAFTVNRNQSAIRDRDAPYASRHGAGFRAVYDLADLDRSIFSIALGQSGNPLSPHYRDQLRPWRDFEYLSLSQSREDLERAGAAVLTLVPQRLRTSGRRRR